MLAFSLALAAQSTLTSPAAQDAARCASAAVVAAPAGELPIRTTAHFMYYAMQATHIEPGEGPYLERLGAMAETAGSATPPAGEEAQTRITDCDRRFPLANTSAAPRLPANAFERDVMCLGILSLMQGAAEAMREDGGDASAADNIKAALQPVSGRLNDQVLAKQGLTSEDQFVKAMGDQIRASLKIGNPATISRACGAAI